MEVMNVRRPTSKLARLNLTKAQREADAIKAEFRREDQALARAGRAREVLGKNVAALGWDLKGERARLLSINGVRFRS